MEIMYRTIKTSALLAAAFALSGCQDAGYQISGIKAFLNESTSSNQIASTEVTFESSEPVTLELTATLSDAIQEDAVFELVADSSIMDRYNSERNSAFNVLPESQYHFGDPVTISAGSYSAPVRVTVDPLPSDLADKDMALPVRLKCTSGNVEVTSATSAHVFYIESVDTLRTLPMFIGGADLASSALDIAGTGKFTVEVKFQVSDFNNRNRGVFSSSEMLFRFEDPQSDNDSYKAHTQMQYQATGSSSGFANANIACEADKWQHFAATYDGSTIRLYVNGKAAGTSSSITVASTSFPSCNWFLTGGSSWWSGCKIIMTEARIWTVCRTEDEIAGNMQSVSAMSDGLAAYWTLDIGTYDEETNTFSDLTGNGYTLTPGVAINSWIEDIGDSSVAVEW